MEEHEAAGLFPPMSEAEFEALVADISENGLREPIVTFSGKILDGRHRWRACKRLNLSPTMVEWDGGGSPMAFVASMNLHRRHLDEGVASHHRHQPLVAHAAVDPPHADQRAEPGELAHRPVAQLPRGSGLLARAEAGRVPDAIDHDSISFALSFCG